VMAEHGSAGCSVTVDLAASLLERQSKDRLD
jgi:hypothetical protein